MNRYKYPRTYHLPFSLGHTSDDKVLNDDSQFYGKRIIITEKMDGENTTIYNDYFHTRSIDSKHKEYHSWLISNMYNFNYLIPIDYRICGEYLYAEHSIHYDKLSTYFMAFSVWNKNECLNWSNTVEFCKKLNIETVPLLYDGVYNKVIVKEIAENIVKNGGEGIVIRLYDSFKYDEFSKSVAKYVRPNHVQTNKHWSQTKIRKNNLGEK